MLECIYVSLISLADSCSCLTWWNVLSRAFVKKTSPCSHSQHFNVRVRVTPREKNSPARHSVMSVSGRSFSSPCVYLSTVCEGMCLCWCNPPSVPAHLFPHSVGLVVWSSEWSPLKQVSLLPVWLSDGVFSPYALTLLCQLHCLWHRGLFMFVTSSL